MARKIDALLKKKSKLLDEILQHSDFVKGSLYKVQRKGEEKNFYHLTYKDEEQKTRTKYVSNEVLKKAEKAIESMEIVNNLINEISKINLELLKQD